MPPIRIFISYAHEDEIWLQPWLDEKQEKRNRQYLLEFWERSLLAEDHKCIFWWDGAEEGGLRGGDRWRSRIFEEIDRSDVVVLLISQDFVISPFIREEELPRILARAKRGEIEVVPVLLAPALWKKLDIHGLFHLTPGKATPLSRHLDAGEDAWKRARLEVAEALVSAVQRTTKNRKPSIAPAPPASMPSPIVSPVPLASMPSPIASPARPAPMPSPIAPPDVTHHPPAPARPEEGLPPADGRAPIYLDQNVQFSVYRPRAVLPAHWHPMLVFAHLSEPREGEEDQDPLAELVRQARQALGDQIADFQDVRGDSVHAVPREGEITFVPVVADVEFNPPSRTFLWQEAVHKEEFRLRAAPSLDGQTARGRLTVFLGTIILADIALSIRVDSAHRSLSRTEDIAAAHARPYRMIFASYSHKDAGIVEEFERQVEQSALGDRYLRDCRELRAGEVWNERLMDLIEAANVFQLFWSNNSMLSPFVRQEWEYAISLGRQYFVRPVYWENPMPCTADGSLPPQALRRLHFQQVSFDRARPIGKEARGHVQELGSSLRGSPMPEIAPRLGTVRLAAALSTVGDGLTTGKVTPIPRIGTVRILQRALSPADQNTLTASPPPVPRLGRILLKQRQESGPIERTRVIQPVRGEIITRHHPTQTKGAIAMQSQSFFVRTGDNGTVSYQVIIPVLNMTDGYSLRVKADDGADVPCRAGENAEYVIDRTDGPGQFKATVAIVDARGSVCDERLIEISSSPATNPAIMDAVAKVLEKYSSGSFPGNVFAELHTRAGGEDVAAACEHYFNGEATTDWRLRCLAYLMAAANSPQSKPYLAMVMKVIHYALGLEESGDSLNFAVNIGLRVNVPPPSRFSFLSRALQCSFPNTSLYPNILNVIVGVTPSSERLKVGAIASELFATYTDYAVRCPALNVISAFGYRDALPVMLDVLTTSTDSNILRLMVPLLQSWNATSSAPGLVAALDLTTDHTLTCSIMQALKQFGFREAIPQIEQMIPVSGADKARALDNYLKDWK